MKALIPNGGICLIFLLFSTFSFAQNVELGSSSGFVAFTAVGAFSNDGASELTGDIGTNVGAFTGFPPGVVNGDIHVADPLTATAATDVDDAYSYLAGLTCGQVIGTTLGNGQILLPDIYCLGAASVLEGDLYLDAQGDPSSIFIFQIDGALSTNTLTNIYLVNGADVCNVYWQINGAFALGDGSSFKGTIVANGAISLFEGSSLEGRALTRQGAIDLHNVQMMLGLPPVVDDIAADGPVSFCEGDSVTLSGGAGGTWNTGAQSSSIVVSESGDYYFFTTNGCGSDTSNHIVVSVVPDDIPPFITCPPAVTISCDDSTDPADTGNATASDNCDPAPAILYSDVIAAGSCAESYVITRTFTSTDIAGNTSTCSQEIIVQDITSPTITCPDVVTTIQCGTDPFFGIATATDVCDPEVDITFVTVIDPGTCGATYATTRTWTATDNCGNTSTCSVTITVEDNAAPIITCPTVITPIVCGTIPEFGIATAIDGCGGEVTITFSTDSVAGSCPQLYVVTRIWTATDACGNTSTCAATIIIEDTEAPLIICPVAVSPVECGAEVLFGDATATDNCDLTVAITFTDQFIPGECASGSSLTRTWTATDDCGNTATCSLTIEVQDNTPPIISCPTVPTNIQCGTDPFFGTATATDACDPDVTITFETIDIPGACVGEYSSTRTWTATDACGNTATCSVTINVQDVIAPEIICPVVTSELACGMIPVFGDAVASDLCDPSVDVTFMTDSIPGVCDQAYSLTRTWTATDDCGNTATCSATITVQDNAAPIIICPTVTSPIVCGSDPDFGIATATDVCDSNVDITFVTETVAGVCPQLFVVTRTWMATDDCGNTASCSATIIIEDTGAPILVCPAVVSPIACGSVPVWGDATATDICDASVLISFVTDVLPGECGEAYSTTRTWTATDDCGNTSTCSATIVVEGSAGLVMVCPPSQSVQCAGDVSPVNVNLVVVTGNCGDVSVTHLGDVITNQTCLNDYILTRTYLATDVCGNTTSCSQIITVSDQLAPVIEFVNPLLGPNGTTIYVQCYGQDPAWDIPAFSSESVNATDNCSESIEVTYSQVLEDQGDCTIDGYINLYRLTWTATDACSNTSTAFVFMALVDTIPPAIEGVPDNVTVSCNDIPEPPSVFATDECLCACVVLFEETESAPEACQDGLVIIRTWTARDRCGNETIATQLITLIDEVGPELIIVQPEITGFADGSIIEYTCTEGGIPGFYNQLDEFSVLSPVSCGGSAIVTYQHHKVIANNCEFWGYLEQRIFQWIALDACGNQTSLTLIVRLIDDEAPVLVGIPEMACIGDPGLQDIYAIDNCDHASVRFSDSQIPNPCGPGVAVKRTYEAFDDCGNMATASAILLPDGQNPPVIVFNHPELLSGEIDEVMRVECASDGQGYTGFDETDVTVIGVCSAEVTVVFSERLISTEDCIDGGVVAVLELKWTATDICGNQSQAIRMAHLVDQTSPVFAQFKPVISIGCHEAIPGVSATDNCSEVVINITEAIIPGACIYEYTIQRQVTATDECGNVTTRDQVIHVGNGGGPVITGVVPEICDDLSIPIVTAYDACAEAYVDVIMQQDTLDITCRDGLVIRRIWTAVDACGHESTVYQTIFVNDLAPPVIYVPTYSVIHLYIDQDHNIVYHSEQDILEQLDALDENSVTVVDDCDQWILAVFTVDTLFAEDCLAAGYAQRRIYTWMAEDVCGNSTSMTFTVDVMDDMAPVFRSADTDTITIICEPMPAAADMILVDTLEATIITFTEVMEAGAQVGEYIITRTWMARDSCDNTTTHIQVILWIPESGLECLILLPESIECNSHGVIVTSLLNGGYGPYTYDWTVVGEKCFIQGGQGTPDISLYVGWSDVKIILEVTDTFGCISMCMTTVECNTAFGSVMTDGGAPIVLAVPAEGVNQIPAQFLSATETGISQISLWPNPARETLNLSFVTTIREAVQFSLIDFLGHAVLEDRIEASTGTNHHEVSIGHLPEGIYLARLQTQDDQLSEVIVILRN